MSPIMENIESSGIYNDLMREFRNQGHEVYIIYPRERRFGQTTELKNYNNICFCDI